MNPDSCNTFEFQSSFFRQNCNYPIVSDGGNYSNPVKTT